MQNNICIKTSKCLVYWIYVCGGEKVLIFYHYDIIASWCKLIQIYILSMYGVLEIWCPLKYVGVLIILYEISWRLDYFTIFQSLYIFFVLWLLSKSWVWFILFQPIGAAHSSTCTTSETISKVSIWIFFFHFKPIR